MIKKHILLELDKYMFSAKNMDYIDTIKNSSDIIDNIASKTKTKHTRGENNTITTSMNSSAKLKTIYPSHKDNLFWCFFIMLKGEDEYNYSHKGSFKIEKDLKIQSIEKMKEYSPQLKLHKIKYLDIENELLNEKCISVIGLYALCLVYDISVIYIKGKTYYEINNNNTEIKYIIEKKGIDDTSITLDVDHDTVTKIRSDMYKIENIAKPIKSVSSYKVDELKEICKKLEIPVVDEHGKNLKKTILYEGLVKKI